MMKFIDIGANLTDKCFKNNIETILKESLGAGVDQIIITGTSERSSQNAIELCRKYIGPEYPKLWCTVGCHPHNAVSWTSKHYGIFKSMIEDNKDIVVAVGETGLDYNRNFSDQTSQQECFKDQIQLAKRFDLPLFLHERDAFVPFVDILKRESSFSTVALPVEKSVAGQSTTNGKIRGVVHCFTGNGREIAVYLKMGFYIGLTGFITKNNRNQETLKAIRKIPEDRLLLETDCPYMTPANLPNSNRRTTNYPKYISYVAQYLSEFYDQDYIELASICHSNTRHLFSI